MAELASYPLLSTLLALPLLGGLLTALLRRAPWAQWIALASAVLTVLCSLLIVAAFDGTDPDFQLLESANWIPGIEVRYLVGIDGISVLFLPATALLFCGAIIAGWRISPGTTTLAPGVYLALLLLLEAATLGVFCALDTILFFFCWEFTLLPLYFLVSLWGGAGGRQAAAVRYFLVMLAGGVPLLFGLLALAFGHAEGRPAGVRSADPAGDAAAGANAVRRVPAAVARLWRQGAAGAPAHLAALDGHGGAGGGDGAARRPQARRLRADPLRHPAGADRRARPALAARRFRHRGDPLRRRRSAGAEQSAPRAGVFEPGARRAGVLGLASFSVSALQGALLQLLNFSVAAGGGFLVLSFLQRRTGSTDITSSAA
jgi:NADH-quinone oxidoreductase subunit M